MSRLVALLAGLLTLACVTPPGLLAKVDRPLPKDVLPLHFFDTPKDTLEKSGFLARGGSEAVTVHLQAGKTYVIDEMSMQFDSFLKLEEMNGQLIRSDDDGGEGLNSRIVFTCQRTGPYRVVAGSLGNVGQGAYSLSVRRQSP